MKYQLNTTKHYNNFILNLISTKSSFKCRQQPFLEILQDWKKNSRETTSFQN